MEIQKKLNLNKTPYNTLNYSMCFAKNVKLSEDNTSIITDNGVSLALPTGDLQIDGNIVGIIPCSNELVILTDADKIYRGKEQFNTNVLDLIECETAWTYSGGTINGAYTYNVKNELIISIAEYKDDILIPLKTINLDTATAEDIDSKYEVCPPMPITNMKQIQIVKGKLIPTGIYYFFCRYEIDDEYYTDWMPIGIPYYAINMESKSLININLYAVSEEQAVEIIGYNDRNIKCNYNGNINNINNDSPYNPKLRLTIHNYYNYKNIQIGYILQHENATVCRSWKKFKCDNIIDFIFDTSDFEEYSITDMLSTPFNIYNVKNICNYENRLYIANYNETDFNAPKTDNRLIQAAAKIKAYQVFENVEDEFTFKTGGSSDNYNSIFTFKTPIGDFEYIGSSRTDYIELHELSGFLQALYDNRFEDENNLITPLKKVTPNSSFENEIRQHGFRVWFYNIDDVNEHHYAYLNYISLYLTDQSRRNPYFVKDDPNNQNDRHTVYLYEDGGRGMEHLFYINSAFDSTSYNHNYPPYYYYGSDDYSYPNTLYLADKDPALHLEHGMSLDEYEYFYEIDISTCTINKVKKLDTLVDNSIRTLMPNDVYAFYVHYIRKDGTYTNGIPLENTDAVDKYSNGIVLDKSSFAYRELLETNEELKHFEIGYYPIDENTNEAPFNYYENIEGKKLFATSNGYRSETIEDTINNKTLEVIKNKVIIKVKFTNIDIPDGYYGCFFSYEKPAELVKYHGYITGRKNDENGLNCIRVKATEVECGKVNYHGDILMPYGNYKCINWHDQNVAHQDNARKVVENMGYIVDSRILAANTLSESTKYISDTSGTYGCEGCIQMHVINDENTLDPTSHTYFNIQKGGCECYIKSINRNIYTNKNKELISFGGILEVKNNERNNLEYSETTTRSNFKYPIFYTVDKMLIYRKKVNINDTTLIPTAINNNIIVSDSNQPVPGSSYSSPPYEYLYTAYINLGGTDPAGGNARFWYGYYRTVNKYSKYNLNTLYLKNKPTEVAIGCPNDIRINTIVYPKNLTDLFDIHNDYIEKEYKSYINYNDYTTTDTLKLSTIRRSDIIADESTENAWRHFRANAYKVINRNKGDITNIVGLGLYLVIHTTQTLFILDKTALLKTETKTVGIESPDTFDCEPLELFVTQHGYGGLQTIDGWCVNHIGYFFVDRDNNRIFLLRDNKINDLTADIIKYIEHYKIKDCKLVTDFKNNRILISITHKNDNITTLSYNYVVNSFISIHDFKFNKGYSTKNRTYLQGNDLTNIYVIDKSIYGDYKELYYVNPNLPNYNEENITTSVIDVIVNSVQDNTKTFYERVPLDYDYNKELDSITYSVNKVHAFEDNDYMADEYLDTQRENDITHYSGDKLKIYTNITDSGLLNIAQPEQVNNIEEYKIPYFNKGSWSLNYFRNKITTPVEENKDFSDNKSLIYGKYFVCRFIFNITNNIPIRFETLTVNSKLY